MVRLYTIILLQRVRLYIAEVDRSRFNVIEGKLMNCIQNVY